MFIVVLKISEVLFYFLIIWNEYFALLSILMSF